MRVENDQEFIKELQELAAQQARWQEQPLMPPPLAGLVALIGRYPLQSLIAVSFISALVMEFIF